MSNTATAEAKKTYLKIVVDNDSDVESPAEDDGWKLHSFSRKHRSYTDPDTYVSSYGKSPDEAKAKPRIAQKLRRGLAFWLSYFEHGGCTWSLMDEGPQCQWDTARFAGILIWEQPADNLGPKTLEKRAEDARNFLKVYTDWANGNCYAYTIELVEADEEGEEPDDDADGEEIDSCGGYIGDEHVAGAIQESVVSYMNQNGLVKEDVEFIFSGDAKGLFNRSDIFK